jgi:hypothetical protein
VEQSQYAGNGKRLLADLRNANKSHTAIVSLLPGVATELSSSSFLFFSCLTSVENGADEIFLDPQQPTKPTSLTNPTNNNNEM